METQPGNIIVVELRYYQENAVQSLFEYFGLHNGNPVVAMPTGTGKSLVIGEFVRRVLTWYSGQRMIILTHVKELIDQDYKALLSVWPQAPAGIYSAGLDRYDTHLPVIFGGIASVYRNAHLFEHRDLGVVDECHLVNPKVGTMYEQYLSYIRKINPRFKLIGLSATPYRLGMGLVTDGGLFTDVCFDITGLEAFNRLIAEGYLVPLLPKKTHGEIDVSGVAIQGGEFNLQQLQEVVDDDKATWSSLQELVYYGQDRASWLIFAAGVKHAIRITEMLEQMNVPVACVHSKMPDIQRDINISAFKAGRVRAIVNNNVLTTGFDHPPIDMIGMLRPTNSPGLWVQMLGRGTRPSLETGKQNCLVLDFAGNTARLGPINDPRIPKRRGKKKGTAPVRLCPKCGYYMHASVTQCPVCGKEFPRGQDLTEASKLALIRETGLGGAPVVETHQVHRIVYSRWEKIGRPDSIKVAYHCGLSMFREWICLEHGGYAAKKARDWWRERTDCADDEIPTTTAAALERLDELAEPRAIRVWMRRENPEIMGYEF